MALQTPVLLIGFNRPDLTRRVLSSIAKVRPTSLYFAVDGPRNGRPDDNALCSSVRQLVDQIDWNCKVKTRFVEHNLGCKAAIESAITWFLQDAGCGIILEDDCVPNESFFEFCDQMLIRYADAENVMCISGDNFLDPRCTSINSYYFSKYMHCWGWATWQRAWRHYDANLSKDIRGNDAQIISHYPTTPHEIRYWSKRFEGVRQGRINTWDYAWQYSIWRQSGLVISPPVNLVENIGFGSAATHTTATPQSNLPMAQSMTVQSHPLRITQNVELDQLEAQTVYRFGQKTFITRTRNEVRRLWTRLSLT